MIQYAIDNIQHKDNEQLKKGGGGGICGESHIASIIDRNTCFSYRIMMDFSYLNYSFITPNLGRLLMTFISNGKIICYFQ